MLVTKGLPSPQLINNKQKNVKKLMSKGLYLYNWYTSETQPIDPCVL